ncbi:dynein light chain Tctex-type 1-like [Acipenser oxyrinchus oxyrinchus]|uniref:Dynein light chain Tctex-type 1 n=1 Tax=Acipenser oxyrinchus oxyrinchus TaxID=40147 RepID=A0AAD8GBU1_ACIOX|nr:dynein light chain Tctex-type 1-like [Acipenser oxyrinchus oxyrinchus]
MLHFLPFVSCSCSSRFGICTTSSPSNGIDRKIPWYPLLELNVTDVRMRIKWSTGSSYRSNMEEFQTGEETTFVVDEVSTIIKESVEVAIGGNAYTHSRVNQWTSNVVEQCLNQLAKLGKPFKYIVTCIIMQKNGAGLQTASSCFWDNSTDGSCTVRWENKSMYCIVSVFGLAL